MSSDDQSEKPESILKIKPPSDPAEIQKRPAATGHMADYPPAEKINATPPFSLNIELLLKKAAVDINFRMKFVEKRTEYVKDFEDLKLNQAEMELLDSMPKDQLRTIIANTQVPEYQESTFQSLDFLSMRSALGDELSEDEVRKRIARTKVTGHMADRPPEMPPPSPAGAKPDRPENQRQIPPREDELEPKKPWWKFW